VTINPLEFPRLAANCQWRSATPSKSPAVAVIRPKAALTLGNPTTKPAAQAMRCSATAV
jgi:hypothetical protein